MNQPARPYNPRLFILYVAVSLAAVFYLPEFFRVKPAASASYAFGYNNTVGVALALALAAIGAIWTNGLGITFLPPASSRRVSGKTLTVALLILFCCCGAMYTIAGRFGGFGESAYGIDRIWLLAQGRRPYIDFEWPFGAALLYIPLFLSRALRIDIANGYYIFWILSFLVGATLLWSVVNRTDYPSPRRATIFRLLYFAGLLSVLNMGEHYTFLRYSCPLLFVLIVFDKFKGRSTSSSVASTVLAVAFTITLLLISPETAVALAFGSICIFQFTGEHSRAQRLTFTCILILAEAAVFAVAAKMHIFDTMKASGGGADSFPIGPAPHILLFFAALFLCACYLVRRFRCLETTDNTFALIAYSVPMTAAALGRCDLLHVAWNGEGIFLAALLYASNSSALWRWARSLFLVFAIIYPALLAAIGYSGPFATVAAEQLRDRGDGSWVRASLAAIGEETIEHLVPASRRSTFEAKLKKAERPAIPDSIDLAAIYPSWHGDFLAPAAYRPHGEGFGGYMSPQIDYGYYQGFENANTTAAIQRKVAELKENSGAAILLPGDFFESRCTVNFASIAHGITMNWGFPYLGHGAHSDNARKPICDWIKSQYVVAEQPSLANFGYALWVPRAAAQSSN